MKREGRSGTVCENTVVHWRFRGGVRALTVSVGDRNGTIWKRGYEEIESSQQRWGWKSCPISLFKCRKEKFSERQTKGTAASVISPKNGRRDGSFEAEDGRQAEGSRAVIREVTQETGNLLIFDVLSGSSLWCSLPLQCKTSCKPTLSSLSRVSIYLFNTL